MRKISPVKSFRSSKIRGKKLWSHLRVIMLPAESRFRHLNNYFLTDF